MDTKRWAWFYIFLVGSSHLGNHFAVGNEIPEDSLVGCKIEGHLWLIIDRGMENINLQVDKEYQVRDMLIQDFRVGSIRCRGLDNMKVTAYHCICYRDFIRIFIHVSITDVLLTFILSLNGILGGALQGLLQLLAGLLQSITTLLVKLLLLNIDVIIVVDERFKEGKLTVKDIYVAKLGKVSILNIDLSALFKNLVGGLVNDFLGQIVSILVTNELKEVIIDEFDRLIVEKGWHNCPMPNPSSDNDSRASDNDPRASDNDARAW